MELLEVCTEKLDNRNKDDKEFFDRVIFEAMFTSDGQYLPTLEKLKLYYESRWEEHLLNTLGEDLGLEKD